MNLSFQVEEWAPFYADAKPLMRQHWEEIALDRDVIPLALDEAKYQKMSDDGILHVLTAREGSLLRGYYLAFVLPHTHYATSGKMAFTDIYFLQPSARTGSNGIRLFEEAERTLRELGVSRIYLSTKVKRDCGSIFESLGFKLSDRVFIKSYGGVPSA